MRIFKTDGRYKLHDRGFHHIVEFRWHGLEDKTLFQKLFTQFTEMYGPARYVDPERGLQVWNDNWRFEQSRSAKRRRIYLKEDTGLSLALLKLGV